MVVKAVIGANYGDEGKGLMTDYFCHQALSKGSCLNVLTNGGAQRGHTVCTLNKRHTFHHLGSGTFAGADTYIPEQYVCNPLVFSQEYSELSYLNPKIYIHPNCLVTTPYDMITDQILRERRNVHDTCGFGVYYTKERKKWSRNYHDYLTAPHDVVIKKHLEFIRNYYKEQLGIIEDKWQDIFNSENLIDNFISDLRFMNAKSEIASNQILKKYDYVIFENAQGLLLDKDIDSIHGTSSNTGLKAVFDILGKEVVDDFEACYVSRTYLTRHGDGNLPGECKLNFKDKTNVFNEHQGYLRYAPLNVDSLITRIQKDACEYLVDISVAFTHADEISAPFTTFKKYVSYGDTRNAIKIMED